MSSRHPQLFPPAASIALSYALFAGLWIVFSDRMLESLVSDLKTLSQLQTLKGGMFVVVTTGLIFALVHRLYLTLHVSEERYREVVEGTDNLITQVDEEGRFTYVNRRSLRYLGLPHEQCLGRLAFDFVHPDDQELTLRWFQKCLSEKVQSSRIENRLLTPDGQITPILWTASFRYLANTRLEGVRAIGQDISDRKAIEQALTEHLRLKSEFISTAAHELRTPLATIVGYAELLATPPDGSASSLSTEQKEYAETILDRSVALAGIIDDLLDLSRIDAGQDLPLHLEACDLGQLCERIIHDFRTRFPKRRFVLELPPGVFPVKADHDRLAQIIENLIDNALKYSPDEQEVTLTCCHRQSEICITIRDHGIGMTEEAQQRIFEPFFRADASNTAVPGLGLGLSIVQKIVQGHEGRIEVESKAGQGTALTVCLPGQCNA
ncbi:MAG: hypothetical protein C0621_10325 [Desulfuromonas sp.]|nr:MAG: hypothetical protein C0621_10325 [Desulfuromonas sp.]